MGVEIAVSGLTKQFGKQLIWGDVTLTLPAGEISVLLGPSGTGKSVFLKSLVGLIRPEEGSIVVDGRDITQLRGDDLYEVRKLFGVLFQDGALFGSMNLFDNVAFPLREHTRKSESEIASIVREKMDLVGLSGAEDKLGGPPTLMAELAKKVPGAQHRSVPKAAHIANIQNPAGFNKEVGDFLKRLI